MPSQADSRLERPDFKPEKADFRPERGISGLIGQISGLRGPGGDGRMDGQMNKSPRVLQDFVPFGAAAMLPLTLIHNCAKQGNGYR